MLRASLGLLTLAVIVTISVFGLDSRGRHLSAADGFAGPCNGQLAVTLNDGDHPDLWPKSELEITVEGEIFQLDGPSPIISVSGTIDANGVIQAFGEGTYAEIMVFVTFQGTLTGSDPKQPDLLEGEYSVGAKGQLPGGQPIDYGLDCPVKPPPDKTYTITVLKQDADTKEALPGWEMNLYAGHGCEGDDIDRDFTGGDGIAEFAGLAPGDYSVEEKMQAGWNNITPLCQDTSVPATAGSSVSGLPPCPIQPDEPFPDPGCDEFNSVASVNIEFFNPPDAQIHCALGGPTQVTRGAVTGSPDNIQTEITVLDLTGTCDPGGVEVSVRLSSDPDRASTGKITEQQNVEDGVLEFKANSFFDIYFEVDTPLGKLHNQEALHLECKIQDIPPFGCFYEPDVGTVTLFNEDKKEVATLVHAAHIPLDPKQKLLIFINEEKDETTTPTPTPEVDDTPTPEVDDTPTAQPPGDTSTPTPTASATKTPQPQRTRHATLRCVRTSADQKVTGTVTVTEKKDDQPTRTVYQASCNSNTNPIVRASYSISAGATKNVALSVTVDTRDNDCSFPGFGATQRVSVNCTASPEGLEFVDTESEAGDGDANKNGTVDSIDAALILQFVAGLTGEWPNSDTNGDGTTNAIDVALILQFTAGFLNGLPA